MIGFSLFFILLQVKFNINMRYKEIFFRSTPDNEAIRDIICATAAEAGCESFEMADDGVKAYIQIETFDPEVLESTTRDFPLPGVTINYEVSDVEDRNWNEEWETAGFEPIRIGNRCLIYDAKHTKDDGEDGEITDDSNTKESPAPCMRIGIDACQAFGTGNHETTRMVVATLLDLPLSGRRVLDCGCGSGILGIAAAKAGAQEVVGYDIDEWSVNNTRHNAALNGVEINALEGDASVLSHINGVFDVVMANINRNILLADLPAFKDVMAANAILILSGFYEEDADLLLKKANELGLHEKTRRTENGWCCLSLSAGW